MELATIELKLFGNPNNTVIRQKVTPAELAIYVAMHGEDCVNNIIVTGQDNKSTVRDIMDDLRNKFVSNDAREVIAKLFPGMTPQLPVTFRSIGYDPAAFGGNYLSVTEAPVQAPDSFAVQELQKRIKENSASAKTSGNVSDVTEEDIDDLLNDIDEDGFDQEDDPEEVFEEELKKVKPAPKAKKPTAPKTKKATKTKTKKSK